MVQRLRNEELYGQFVIVEGFEWKDGGGWCVKGMIQIFQVRIRQKNPQKDTKKCVSKEDFVDGQEASRKPEILFSDGCSKNEKT